MRYDYLIIGQGLAGSILAYKLVSQGKRILVIDQGSKNSSSQIAAGIQNPITGRRFVKSWRFDDFFSESQEFYRAWEEHLNAKVFQKIDIHRALFTHEEQNDFLGKSNLQEYSTYMSELDTGGKDAFAKAVSWVCINGARLDLKNFLMNTKAFLENANSYRENVFDFGRLVQQGNSWKYANHEFDKVVCCEGYRITQNPYFSHLPFVLAKGEILIARIPKLDQTQIYKHKLFLVPLGNELFWIGSTYQWDFVDEEPTEVRRNVLVSKLEECLNIPFEIIDHLAAIRPTGKDRRPYLGGHHIYSNLYVFNALGTKGTSLAPYWSEKLIEHMERGEALSQEVDVKRFL